MGDRDRFRRVRALFDEASDLAPEERGAFLDRTCGEDDRLREEVEALLAMDADGAIVDRVVGRALGEANAPGRVGTRIGAYRILSELGAGGMGTVYLAERADELYQRRVAVKIVRGALDDGTLVARLEAERRILGRLEHPGIAGILDGGTTGDGLPYVVLEHVEGRPIDAFVAERKPSLRERLELFLQVCDAVSYAHERLVVHRDLKPSNILVTDEGRVRLLDFGIAKLLEADRATAATLTEARAMTPEYASPEQIQGAPVTTATDVHGLGILLYELLTGRHPYRRERTSRHELERAVLETDPEPPSLAASRSPGDRALEPSVHGPRELRGDLDTIVLTALRKNPGQRYGSASELASDVRRHLRAEPIQARPATVRYRTGRFLRRHALAVTTAVTVLVALAAATGFSLRAYRQAETARAEAEARNLTLAEVNRFLGEIFASADPVQSQSNEDVTARDLLDVAAERIVTELQDRPEVAGPLHLQMGSSYDHLGAYEEAETQFREAVAALAAAGRSEQPETVDALIRLAETLANRERLAEADSVAGAALAIARSAGEPLWISRAHRERGEVLRRAGDLAAAQTELESALAAVDRAGDDAGDDAGAIANALALTYKDQGRLEDAERTMRVALDHTCAYFGDEHSKTGQAWTNLAYILVAQERAEEALECTRRALGIYESVFEEGHYQTAITRFHYANALYRLERYEEASGEYAEVLAVFEGLYGPDHSYVATVCNSLGLLHRETGEFKEAVGWLIRAREVYTTVFGGEHPYTLTAMHNLAEVHVKAGDGDLGERLCRETLALRRRELGPDHTDVGRSALLLGEILLGREAWGEAGEQIDVAERILTSLSEDHPLRARAREARARLNGRG